MSSFKNKKIKTFIVLGVFILIVISILPFYSPDEIVEFIGVKNGYILIAVASLIGGHTSYGSILFITILTSLILGGLNPIYLWIISSINLTIGDVIIFKFGESGIDLLSDKWDKRLSKLTGLFNKKKIVKKFTPLISYLYIGFSPLPNDVLLLFLSAIKYPFKKVFWIIFLGDLTFVFVLIYIILLGGDLI